MTLAEVLQQEGFGIYTRADKKISVYKDDRFLGEESVLRVKDKKLTQEDIVAGDWVYLKNNYS